MIPQIEQFVHFCEERIEGKLAKQFPSGHVELLDRTKVMNEFARNCQMRYHRPRILKTFISFCQWAGYGFQLNADGRYIDINWHFWLGTFLEKFPKSSMIEGFNYYRANKIVVASYTRSHQMEIGITKVPVNIVYWVSPSTIINREQGEIPYLIGLNAGHYTSWVLVYVDASFSQHSYTAIDTLADIYPSLVECEDPDEYAEDDIAYYGNNSIPIYAETIRLCVQAKRVNYRANYNYLFEGEYTFPKERE